jgi:hypothetical protein
MKRIVLLTAIAAMMAAAVALSGVAQAKPTSVSPDAKCAKLASQTLGKGFNPADYTFHGGTEGNDDLTAVPVETIGPDVFCGFGGDDEMTYLLDPDDIFLGGAGNDSVITDNFGTFYGGEGDDLVGDYNVGTFYGGAGNDRVGLVNGRLFGDSYGTFYGGPGNDTVENNDGGTFNGDAGDDTVEFNFGIFNGGPGLDTVVFGNPPVDGPSGT